jgi:hypothetical protein
MNLTSFRIKKEAVEDPQRYIDSYIKEYYKK